MPELPDVAVVKTYLGRTALHKRVQSTRVFDESVIKDVTRRTLQRRLKNRELSSTRRWGKHLFVELDSGDGWLGLHFGMTGLLQYHKDAADTPEHTRVRLHLSNGYHLSYVCRRKLGAVRIVGELKTFAEEHDLGPDALETDRATFVERLQGRRGGIKSALMNQSVVSGLGNVYTDEILLAARRHPDHPVADLNEDALEELFDKMKYVLETAIEAKADPSDMPDTFLLPHRSEGEACPVCGGEIEKITVSGRSTYYCPSCQPKP